MAVTLRCSCGKKLSVGDHLAGKRIKCPGCSEVLTVPAVGEGSEPKHEVKPEIATRCGRCGKAVPRAEMVKSHNQLVCRPCMREGLLTSSETRAANQNRTLVITSIVAGLALVGLLGAGVVLYLQRPSRPSQAANPAATAPAPEPPPTIPAATQPPPVDAQNVGEAAATSQPAAAIVFPPFRYQPAVGARWTFRLEMSLEPMIKADGSGLANRFVGDMDVTLAKREGDHQHLNIAFRKLDVAKPFTRDDYRGSEKFPGNVLGKNIALLLGPNKGKDVNVEGWPVGFPLISDEGDPILQEEDLKDKAGLAFKMYVAEHVPEMLGQAFLFLGRDMLPKDLGGQESWDVTWPFPVESRGRAPILHTLTRAHSPETSFAIVSLKSKADFAHKDGTSGKVDWRLKWAGQGNWRFNQVDCQTDSLTYTARIEEELVENNDKAAYVFKLTLNRIKEEPGLLAAANQPATPPAEMKKDQPAENPSRPEKPVDKPMQKTEPPAAKPEPMKPEPPASPDAAARKDADPKPEPAVKPEAAEMNEKLAQSKLKQARQLAEDGMTADAIEFCETILKRYPQTKAAAEARQFLEKLKKM